MARHRHWLSVLVLAVALAAQQSAAQQKVLALIASQDIKQTHSKFFKGLRNLGYEVDIKQASDSSIKLKEYDTYLYDHLLLFSPKTSGEHADHMISVSIRDLCRCHIIMRPVHV
jgi:hypothetical protein